MKMYILKAVGISLLCFHLSSCVPSTRLGKGLQRIDLENYQLPQKKYNLSYLRVNSVGEDGVTKGVTEEQIRADLIKSGYFEIGGKGCNLTVNVSRRQSIDIRSITMFFPILTLGIVPGGSDTLIQSTSEIFCNDKLVGVVDSNSTAFESFGLVSRLWGTDETTAQKTISTGIVSRIIQAIHDDKNISELLESTSEDI